MYIISNKLNIVFVSMSDNEDSDEYYSDDELPTSITYRKFMSSE